MDELKHEAPKVAVEPVVGVPRGHFESKYKLGEIVEMKQEGAHMFCGQIYAVGFSADAPPTYAVRRADGVMLNFNESELCIRGVDYQQPNAN